MHRRLGILLSLYGGFLLLCGGAGYAITEESSRSSLLNGALAGSLMIVLGILLRQGRMWTMPASVSAIGIFSLTFVWRACIQWYAVYSGNSSHVMIGVLLTLMAGVSIALFRRLLIHYRH